MEPNTPNANNEETTLREGESKSESSVLGHTIPPIGQGLVPQAPVLQLPVSVVNQSQPIIYIPPETLQALHRINPHWLSQLQALIAQNNSSQSQLQAAASSPPQPSFYPFQTTTETTNISASSNTATFPPQGQALFNLQQQLPFIQPTSESQVAQALAFQQVLASNQPPPHPQQQPQPQLMAQPEQQNQVLSATNAILQQVLQNPFVGGDLQQSTFPVLGSPRASNPVIQQPYYHQGGALSTTMALGSTDNQFTGQSTVGCQARALSDPGSESTEQSNVRKRRPYRHESFPQKLHRMLLELKEEGRDDVAAFNERGDAFYIFSPQVFATEIAPKYFRHTRFKSFQRQLSMYGFVMAKRGNDRGAYGHPQFRRDEPELCAEIQRVGDDS